MDSLQTSLVHDLKTSCLATGIKVDASAEHELSSGGRIPISIHEYATTGGVTLELPGRVFLNAAFDEPFCSSADAELTFDDAGRFVVRFQGENVVVRVLPLPGYLGVRDVRGRLVSEVAMSHADRVRISPISGCAFSCQFCDLAATKYEKRPMDQFSEALAVAEADSALPIRHGLISGGTTSPSDCNYFDNVCEMLITENQLKFDVMMTPRAEPTYVEDFCRWGIHGFSLNLEIFSPAVARTVIPQKHRLGHDAWTRSIQRAVELTGGRGRVRSLLVVGLEPLQDTLEGVEYLARLGCDPVLSPFRPARGTVLASSKPPSAAFLSLAYQKATVIAHHYGVRLGPRCIPCQHNTLTFPDDSGDYYFS